jgi:hypothetical protein
MSFGGFLLRPKIVLWRNAKSRTKNKGRYDEDLEDIIALGGRGG